MSTQKTSLYCVFGGGGYFTSSIGRCLKALPAPENTRTVTTVHSTYDEGGCSEKCKKAFSERFQTMSFSPGDYVSGLMFQSLPAEENPFDTSLYASTMTMDLLFNPENRVIVPSGSSLLHTVRKRIAAVKQKYPASFRQKVADSLCEAAKFVDTHFGETFEKLYTEKTSLANLLVLSYYHLFACDMEKTVQKLNTVLHTDSRSFTLPISVEDCRMKMYLTDGHTIDCQHDITCNKQKYTSKPTYMTLLSTQAHRPPKPCSVVNQAIRNTLRGFLFGGGSVFDSTLVHLLTDGIVPEIQKQIQNGRRSVFCLKPMTELQTAGLTLEEILLIYERSIEKLYPNFRIETLFTDIILPAIPEDVKIRYTEQICRHFGTYLGREGNALLKAAGHDLFEISKIMQNISLFSDNSLQDIRTGAIKPAKLGACLPFAVTDKDCRFLESRGIRIHFCRDFGIWENTIQYDPQAIVRLTAQLMSGSPLLENADDIISVMKLSGNTGDFRIEQRGFFRNRVGQVALIGFNGEKRENLVRNFTAQNLPNVRFRASGFMTIEAQHAEVNKTTPIRYIYAKRKLLFPDYHEKKLILICDGDGTLYDKPTADGLPGFNVSIQRKAVLDCLSQGNYLVLNTSNDIDTTIERLLRRNAIPVKYRRQVLVAACNGAILAPLAHPCLPIEDYSDFALDMAKTVQDLPNDFNCLYFGDDTSMEGEDMKAFQFVGRERSVLIAKQPPENLPPILQNRYTDRFATALAIRPLRVEDIVKKFKKDVVIIPVGKSVRTSLKKQDGICLGIDFGGTWLRACLMKFEQGVEKPCLLQEKNMKFDDIHKDGNKSNPFDITAQFLKQHFNLNPLEKYPVGISFSQPIEEIEEGDIRIVTSAKGWNLSAFQDKNLYTLFNESFLKAELPIDLKMIANDVACTHFFLPEADFALVIGTGFAFSCKDTENRISVVEGGEFIPPGMDVIDKYLFKTEAPQNKRAAEKMISGKYIWKNILLHRQTANRKRSLHVSKINLAKEMSQQDILTMAAFRRSGTLAGSMLKAMYKPNDENPVLIIADGTLIQSSPEIQFWIKQAFVPHPVTLNLQHNAAIYGCAKAALNK